MTPKEKAIELVDSYFTIIDGQVEFKLIKQCALIAVDEILKVCTFHRLTAENQYWEEVKQEIENL